MSDQLIDAAQGPVRALNARDGDGLRAAVISDSVYEEIARQRKTDGLDQLTELCQR